MLAVFTDEMFGVGAKQKTRAANSEHVSVKFCGLTANGDENRCVGPPEPQRSLRQTFAAGLEKNSGNQITSSPCGNRAITRDDRQFSSRWEKHSSSRFDSSSIRRARKRANKMEKKRVTAVHYIQQEGAGSLDFLTSIPCPTARRSRRSRPCCSARCISANHGAVIDTAGRGQVLRNTIGQRAISDFIYRRARDFSKRGEEFRCRIFGRSAASGVWIIHPVDTETGQV